MSAPVKHFVATAALSAVVLFIALILKANLAKAAISLGVIWGFGFFVDIDHALFQHKRLFLALRLMREKIISLKKAWKEANKFGAKVNWFHTWPFGLLIVACGVFTLIASHALLANLAFMGFATWAIHICMDLSEGEDYAKKNNIWEIPGIVWRWLHK